MPGNTKTPLAGGVSEKKKEVDALMAIMADHDDAVNKLNRKKYPVPAQAGLIAEIESRERLALFWEMRAYDLEMRMRAWGVPVPPMPKRERKGGRDANL